MLFAGAMLVMGFSGAYRAAFVHLQPINVVAGLFAAYLAAPLCWLPVIGVVGGLAMGALRTRSPQRPLARAPEILKAVNETR